MLVVKRVATMVFIFASSLGLVTWHLLTCGSALLVSVWAHCCVQYGSTKLSKAACLEQVTV